MPLNDLNVDQQLNVTELCQEFQNQTRELGLSLAVLRSGTVEDRAANRGIVYKLITDMFTTRVSEDKLEDMQSFFNFFSPIFIGCDLKRIEFKNADDSYDLTKYDNLARIFRENFAQVQTYLEVLQTIFKEKFPTPEVLLEMMDPLHRPGATLWKEYHNWQNSLGTGYFTRLAGMAPLSNVTYCCTDEARQSVKASFTEDGFILLEGDPVDTCAAGGKEPGCYAFALLPDGSFVLHEHQKGVFQHSSFSGGGPLLCVGMVRIESGKITYLRTHSGHYRPEPADFLNLLDHIPANVFAPGAHIRVEQNSVPGVRDFFMKSSWKWMQKVAHAARSVVTNYDFYVLPGDDRGKLTSKFYQVIPDGAWPKQSVLPEMAPAVAVLIAPEEQFAVAGAAPRAAVMGGAAHVVADSSPFFDGGNGLPPYLPAAEEPLELTPAEQDWINSQCNGSDGAGGSGSYDYGSSGT